MTRKESLNRAEEIAGQQQFVNLSTIGPEGFPYSRLVFNLRSAAHYPHVDRILFDHENRFVMYFGTNASSRKVHQMENNPGISAYLTDLDTWEGVLLIGKAEFLDDRDMKERVWSDDWLKYYSHGVSDPDFSLVRLIPEVMEFYSQLTVYSFSGRDLLRS
ncbi:MAG: pyridoxamine 5'-phosphate oxidase family protein [Spirochaetales bacterium]|nr:pyridoxamine 5'-phosphate oxidase family protein [Spirochaetales bacterium]